MSGAGGHDDDGRLVCGSSTDDLLEQVFDGRAAELDDHQRRCSRCQAVLAETARLWEPLRAAGARPEAPPPGLRAAVMRAVRGLAHQGWSLVLPGARGTTRVSGAVLGAVAERALLGVQGVRGAWARVAAPPSGSPGPVVVVRVSMVAEYGARIPQVASAARARVRAALRATVSGPLVDGASDGGSDGGSQGASGGVRVDVHVRDVASP